VELAQRYANIIRLLFLTFVFAPLIPVASAFGLVALFLNYWVDKIMLLRRHSRPRLLGMELSDNILAWLPVLVLSYAACNFTVCYFQGQKNLVAPSCAFGLAGLFWLLPFRLCLQRKRIEDNVELLERILPSYYDDYVKNAPYFIEDYARVNPVTAQQGWTAWLALVEQQVGKSKRQTWERHSRIPTHTGGTAYLERLYEYAVSSAALSPSNRPLKGQRFSQVHWMYCAHRNPPEASHQGQVRNPFLPEIQEEPSS